MADKSLSTIAQELWQGFNRNPRNRETFEALANVNPIMAAYRGAKTLSNIDIEPLKRAYLNEAYGRNDEATNREAGRQLLNLGSGALDVVPMVPVAKAGLRAAAPALAEGAVNLAEKYGVSPVMSIVPPEGNLNFRPAIEAGKIKGPEKQRAGDMLRQLKNKPGITKEGLKKIRESIGDTNKVMTKAEFESHVPASKYEKVDLKESSEDAMEHFRDQAEEDIGFEDVLQSAGVHDKYAQDVIDLQLGSSDFSDLSPDAQKHIGRIYGIDESTNPHDIPGILEDINEDHRRELVYERVYDLMEEYGTPESGYAYEGQQRLIPNRNAPHDYFEFGVTHPEGPWYYRHYSSGDAPEGLVGHVRGTHTIDPMTLEGGVTTEPNSYIVEEIQSDAQKGEDQVGPLHQVHGTMAKAAIQDAIERGADRIYFPTSYPIGKVRSKPNKAYSSIYDKAIMNEALNPLTEKYGVQLEPLMAEHLFPTTTPQLNPTGEMRQVPYYHKFELTPELKERINLEGLPTPGYAAGGLVDYNEDDVDKMSDQLLQGEYGLRVTGEPKGKGALGEVRMPDGQTVMTEYSINPQGQGEMPSIVEGMHPADLNYLREYAYKALKGEDAGEFPEGVEAVAKRSAQRRKAEGKPAFYDEGGIVDLAAKYARKGQYAIARGLGMGPEVEFATEIPEHYFPKEEQLDGRGDAMRHILFQAQLAQRSPTLAKAVGWAHENILSGGQGDEAQAMDEYNDRLGREIGLKAKDKSDMVWQALQAIDKRKAKTMQPKQNYATGGLVYNDDEISKLADQLIGV